MENIFDRQLPRNRRIAEILALCGLVERSGQGMNLIYELNIKEAKQLPDFTGTDENIKRALDYTREHGVYVEVMKRGHID